MPLMFGTAGEYHGPSTAYEGMVARSLQGFWLAFTKDPKECLRNLGWGSNEDDSAEVIGGENVTVEHIKVSQLDTC